MSADALREQIRAQVRTALGAKATGADTSVAALMQRFEAGYAAVNAEAIVACFAPDVVWTLPDSRVLRGREACLAFLKERFASPAVTQQKAAPAHGLRAGMQVFHPKFGEGKLLTLEGLGDDAKAQTCQHEDPFNTSSSPAATNTANSATGSGLVHSPASHAW